MSSILKITEPITGDTSIDEYEYHEYGTILEEIFLHIPAKAF